MLDTIAYFKNGMLAIDATSIERTLNNAGVQWSLDKMRDISTFDPTFAYGSKLIKYNYMSRRVAGFGLFYKGGLDWTVLTDKIRDGNHVYLALALGLYLFLRFKKPAVLKKKG